MEPKTGKKQAGEYIIYTQNRLGIGTYGYVCEAAKKNNPSKQIYACKTINLLILTENDEAKKKLFQSILEREISILKIIKHKNIVEFVDAILTKHNLYLIFEKCSEGDLYEFQKINRFQESDIMIFLKDILNGYSVLVKNNIIHRDLKPKNILIHNGCFKISDFGFSRFVEDCEENQLLTTKVGSPYYMAPEVYENGIYSNQCDIWSLGVILFEMVFRKTPWKGKNVIELLENVKKQPLEFPEKEEKMWSEDLIDLIKNMLEVDVNKRLTWEKLLGHKVVKALKLLGK